MFSDYDTLKFIVEDRQGEVARSVRSARLRRTSTRRDQQRRWWR
jgi:hypothetical protein